MWSCDGSEHKGKIGLEFGLSLNAGHPRAGTLMSRRAGAGCQAR
jgi:hypothetical protein